MEEETRLTTIGATRGFSPLPLDVETPPVRRAPYLVLAVREALGASEDIPRFGHVVEKAARKDERPAFPRLPLDLRVFRVDALDPHLERVRLDLEDLRGQESPEQPLPWLFAQGLMAALPQVIQRR